MCVFVERYLYIFILFINIELIASSFNHSFLNKAYLFSKLIFPIRAHHGLLAFSNTIHHFSTTLGGHCKQWCHPKQSTKCKKHGTSRLFKCIKELKQEDRASPSLTSAENVGMWWLKFSLLWASLRSATSIDCGVVGRHTNMNLSNDNWLYIFMYTHIGV